MDINRDDLHSIIELAWDDRTPFETIRLQFGLSESEVITLMRRELKRNSFKLWRKRVSSPISRKHARKQQLHDER